MKPNKLTPGSNLMWESSRMMLPEHVAVLRAGQEEMNDVEKPIIGEDKLEEMQRVIQEAMEFSLKVDILYYEKKRINTIEGFIIKLLDRNRIEVDVADGLEFLNIQDIVDISLQ
ncbi:YolD-like family protein [Paraliobacillus sediminis]|uniref:YolD-like family protein n=1 Tax=Paraliobacillus sediminis TaxID=1885916 RepID=UPI000E3E1D3E|nr:YolD-like family protein [Paraliobacillus sediminis]